MPGYRDGLWECGSGKQGHEVACLKLEDKPRREDVLHPTGSHRVHGPRRDLAMKSRRRDKADGGLDKVGGRILEGFSKLTGKRSAGAKGKAARARGVGRTAKNRAKRSRR